MKIAIMGLEYVGFYNGLFLVQHSEAVAYEKEKMINNGISPMKDKDLEEFNKQSDVIMANRLEESILDANDKIFMRDIFGSDS